MPEHQTNDAIRSVSRAGLFPLGPCPIDNIAGIWKMTRPPGFACTCRSTPGHLIQLILRGSYTLVANGRRYRLKPNDLFVFHETEHVEWIGGRDTVVYYSVAFYARRLAPLPIDRRRITAPPRLRRDLRELYRLSMARLPHERQRMRLYAVLLRIVAQVYGDPHRHDRIVHESEPWWDVEQRIRERKLYHVRLDELSRLCHRSRSTIARSCRRALNVSPFERIRAIRMEEARGMLLYSDRTVTEIADALGYGRMHEFSREFRRCFGMPPSEFARCACTGGRA
ncbi:MAG: helix-turn-helix transcriptional regulator [Kiritimatiellae bacterium]|nr:helix-turn-helix transcriptional regulator [Kiritimatiellia bacterium]